MAFTLTCLLSLVLLCAYLPLARRGGWLAEPNARSSHVMPTPSGGGLVLFLSIGLVSLGLPDLAPGSLYGLPLALALILALVCFLDDLYSLPVLFRLLCYGIAAVLGCAWLLSAAGAGSVSVVLLTALAVLGFTNAFNFMDGIDGLAALQCASATLVAAGLACWLGASDAYIALCLSLAGAYLAFLVFNRPPARLFMGDSGSVPAGLLLALLAVAGHWLEGVGGASWLILLAVFIADAGATLLTRTLRGARLAEAHREHLYQRLARRWESHARVDLLFIAVQWCWLSPLAIWAALWPDRVPLALGLAYAPLIFGMVMFRRLQ